MAELKPWSQLMKEYHTGKRTELKPCPFCGTKKWLKPREYPLVNKEEGCWTVYCGICDIRGPWRKTEQQAIDAWNKRS